MGRYGYRDLCNLLDTPRSPLMGSLAHEMEEARYYPMAWLVLTIRDVNLLNRYTSRRESVPCDGFGMNSRITSENVIRPHGQHRILRKDPSLPCPIRRPPCCAPFGRSNRRLA